MKLIPTKLSLRIVVTVGVIAGLVIPMSVATLYTSAKQQRQLMAEATSAHARVTELLALGVQKALWDLSPEGAAPIVRSIMDDQRIVSATILDAQDEVFMEEKAEARRIGRVVSLQEPVSNGDQVIGNVRIEFSLASVENDIAARRIEVLVVAAVQALICIAIVIVLLNRRVLARVEELKRQAKLIAQKSLDQPFSWRDSDEIGELGVALETTRGALKELFTDLERLVAERTATIKVILDHVRSGFLLVGPDLSIRDGYTRSCERLLDATGLAGKTLSTALRLDPTKADHFRLCVEQVFGDVFPEEVSLEQIPKRHTIGDRTLSIEGSTVRAPDGSIAQILFTILDVSLLEQTEKENRANRALVRILQNIASFRDFVHESRDRLATAGTALARSDEATVRRELHTLKGNSSAFGLDDLASLVHAVEDEVRVASEHLHRIESAFGRFLDERYDLLRIRLGEEEPETVAVSRAQLDHLNGVIDATQSLPEVRSRVGGWIREMSKVPIDSLLGPIQSYIETLAGQRGKEVRFTVEGGKMRVDARIAKPVLHNLVHLLRNAIDHGIEAPHERQDVDKEPFADLRVRFSETNGGLRVEVSDDGRGIDDAKVRAKAVGLGFMTAEAANALARDAAVALIFADGLSTADSISDTSGRGVGMSAVKDAVTSLGGNISIRSEVGRGTTFVLDVPCDVASAAETRAA